MPTPLSLATAGAFVALTVALAALWTRHCRATTWLWLVAAVVALVLALAAGLIDVRGVLVLAGLAAACDGAARAKPGLRSAAWHAIVLLLSAGLFLHLLPGFDNPRAIADAALAPDSVPYTKYLNFDKGMAALLLLGIYVRERPVRDEMWRHRTGFVWRVAALERQTFWTG